MRSVIATLGLASVASAHTIFTTFFVDGENQGDGTCVRMPADPETASGPIYPLDGDAMACGRDGNTAVPYICPAPGGATLSFEFREWGNKQEGGSIDECHRGPCAVYVKKVDDMFSDSASGPGWFKIWEDGYDVESDTWCVDTLIANDGLLSVKLPTGLPSGNYLVRPELLALHSAYYDNDPQFYSGCAQVFIENGPEGPLNIPSEYEVSIPGYIAEDHPALSYNLYDGSHLEFDTPGPDVYIPSSSSAGTKKAQTSGKQPEDCLIKNANWCAEPVPAHTEQDACWDSVPVSGGANCEVWGAYCKELNNACEAGDYVGPAKFTGEEIFASSPEIPAVYGDNFKRTPVSGGEGEEEEVVEPTPKPEETTVAEPEEPVEEPEVIEPTPSPETSVVKTETPEPTTTVKPEAPEPTTAVKPTATVEPEPEVPETPEEPEEPEAPETPSTPELKISEDGRCGAETGQTCLGSKFGDCCSKKGKCGRKTKHCTCGCQSDFGECRK